MYYEKWAGRHAYFPPRLFVKCFMRHFSEQKQYVKEFERRD